MAIRQDSWGLEERNVTPALKKGKKEDLMNYRLVSLTLIPGEVMEPLILEAISKHKKDKMVIGIVSKDLWRRIHPSPAR